MSLAVQLVALYPAARPELIDDSLRSFRAIALGVINHSRAIKAAMQTG